MEKLKQKQVTSQLKDYPNISVGDEVFFVKDRFCAKVLDILSETSILVEYSWKSEDPFTVELEKKAIQKIF